MGDFVQKSLALNIEMIIAKELQRQTPGTLPSPAANAALCVSNWPFLRDHRVRVRMADRETERIRRVILREFGKIE